MGTTFQTFQSVITVNTDLIRSDPSVMMGKPVVAGTRITVELILDKLAAGETEDNYSLPTSD